MASSNKKPQNLEQTDEAGIILSNGDEYDEFKDPMHLFSTKLWSDI